jgi:hypothetical protein
MGFLFDQGELMAQARIPPSQRDITALKIDPGVVGNLDLVHITACPPFIREPEMVLAEVEWIASVLDQNGCMSVRTFDDLRKPGLKIIFGLQCAPVPYLTATYPMREGVVFWSLAYEMETEFGGGFATPDVPLSESGKAFIRWLLRDAGHYGQPVILDLSHAGHQTARDALDYIAKERLPIAVCATHSGAYGVYPHLRNLPDDIIRRIADLGGYIGVPALNWMLGDKQEMPFMSEYFLAHLRHAESLVGAECVGIGSDTVYKTLDTGVAGKTFELMKDKLDPRGNFKSYFPEIPEELNCPAKAKGVLENKIWPWFGPVGTDLICGRSFHRFLQRALR